ncbi:Hypothetical protein CINCED_3A024397 [Cinara cedri]|uniref:Uncharacterized protein n=1 Tax=Cinara cedri TaxID=506608 RepID=A0A5E4NNU5_9HEMI|nr:Hypothetical protein CINCED_3A024397 [Cinara cedri]
MVPAGLDNEEREIGSNKENIAKNGEINTDKKGRWMRLRMIWKRRVYVDVIDIKAKEKTMYKQNLRGFLLDQNESVAE